ncbi:hypothetical protein K501DRAFT_319754 [Backusella circina FSU 941]|nr:hypothetical protein K501DRAFT_319754 [Backusella circina FSU 941]
MKAFSLVLKKAKIGSAKDSLLAEMQKFLSYLPHSGFHNQRIALENAVLLATYLNRTLLVPPVYLSQPAMPWSHFDRLYERLIWLHKNGLEYCDKLRHGEPFPPECLNYDRWSIISWDFFYNMSLLNTTIVRLKDRPDMSLDWIKMTLNTTDIHLYKDISPFDFRIYDVPESKTQLGRFSNRVDLHTLKSIESKVLHFGSLFGTHRVLAQSTHHEMLLKEIRHTMGISNPTLNAAAIKIVDRLGPFIGIHVRAGDGLFRRKASITIDTIYHQVVNGYTDLTLSELRNYDANHELDRMEDTNYEIKPLRPSLVINNDTFNSHSTEMPLSVQHPNESILEPRLGITKQTLLDCQRGDGRNDVFSKTTIYIATDIRNARESPLLDKFFKTFPCVFLLDDFKDELDILKSGFQDNKSLIPYMIPMVDLLVSSHGHTFYGTHSSTFSRYIEQLRNLQKW